MVPTSQHRGKRTAEAMQWLREVLEHGPQYTNDILDAAVEDGISHGTLRLAKTALGVEARKDFGEGGAWAWQMPGDIHSSPGANVADTAMDAVNETSPIVWEDANAQPTSVCTDVGDNEESTENENVPVQEPRFNDVLLRAEDIAVFFQVSKSRAYELMADGTLPAFRIGKSVRVSKRSLEQWVRENETGGA